MLPFVLPLFAIWFSRDGKKTWDRTSWSERKQGGLGAYFTSQSFLTASSPCLSVGESSGSRCRASVWSISERALLPAKHHTKSKDTIYAWIEQLLSIKESDRLAASAYWLTSYLGINENRFNVIQQIDRSEPKYIVVNNQVELTSNMKDCSENYRLVEKKYRHFKTLSTLLKKTNILCFRKF